MYVIWASKPTSLLFLLERSCRLSFALCPSAKTNNKQLIDSFKDLFAETVGAIKRSNEDSAEQQMKEINKREYDELHKFKKKAIEDQFNFNRNLAENI